MKNKINVTVSTIFTYSDTYEQDIVENSMSFNADRLKDIKEHQLIATLIIDEFTKNQEPTLDAFKKAEKLVKLSLSFNCEDESFFEMPFMKAIFSRMGKYFFNEKSELIEDAIKQHALGHISKAVMKAEKERFKKMFVQKVS
jgi:hypothetical protein|tara:strand:- start:597 stop:1022 length:426 start_codon:yes stop_codon:yes gene_type:complete